MIARVFGNDHGAGDRIDAVRVPLQGRIPEALRVVLPAGGKADRGRCGIAREGEREAHFGDAAVGGATLALELERLRGRDTRGGEVARVGSGVVAFQYQEREPFPGREESSIEGAEQ